MIKNYIKKLKFKVFSSLLKEYNVEFYFRDSLGVLTKRFPNDNFQYMFSTMNSCDAVPMMSALGNRIKGANLCIDIGANRGITSIWMAKLCNKVYSFEPEKENILRFKENIEINHVNNVELLPLAVSDKAGEMDLNILEGSGHHSLGRVSTSKILGKQAVKVTTLNDFCQDRRINEVDFLKIDVEGFEIEVLKGGAELFQDKKIKLVAFEISKIPLKSLKKSPSDIFDFFDNAGYEICNLDGSIANCSYCANQMHVDLIAQPRDNERT